MVIADLHTHTTASDGDCSPELLLANAVESGVELLALTDHDTLAGYYALRNQTNLPLELISGIELSSQCMGVSVHIVGLNVNADCPTFVKRVNAQQLARIARAKDIADKLSKLGLKGVVEFIELNESQNKVVSRPDIAKFLVESGQVKTIKQAFDRYLGAGKKGDVKQFWPELDEVVNWINEAGGVAVFAHPESYNVTRTKLRRILNMFVDAGGRAIEMPHITKGPDFSRYIERLCQELNLMASVGSDFHTEKQAWRKLGRVPTICENLTPVWTCF